MRILLETCKIFTAESVIQMFVYLCTYLLKLLLRAQSRREMVLYYYILKLRLLLPDRQQTKDEVLSSLL